MNPWIILIIPGLVAIASKHRNLTVLYYGCIYILFYNVINKSQGTILYFVLHTNMRYIACMAQVYFPPGIVLLAVLTTYYIGAFFKL